MEKRNRNERPASRRKGIGLIFPNPDSERARGWRRRRQRCRRRPSLPGRNRGDASEPGDVAGSPGKSSLFFVKDHVRGIGSSGDTEKVPVERRGSGGVRCAFGGPGKSGSGFRSSRVGPYPPSAAGLQGVQPLVDGINVGKGSRQNGSVPSEEGLAPRTGSVGPCPREARNRYGAVAFAPFALCGVGIGAAAVRCAAASGAVAVKRVGESDTGGSPPSGGRSAASTKNGGGPSAGRLPGGGGQAARFRGCFAPGSGWRRAASRPFVACLRPPRKGVRCFSAVSSSPAGASPSAPPTRRPPLLRCPRGAPSLLLLLVAAGQHRCVIATGLVCLRYRLVATGASGGEQNGSSPGSSWSATASSPSSGEGGCCLAAASVPLRPLLSVSLGVGAFVRQRTVNSELVRTGGIRLSN